MAAAPNASSSTEEELRTLLQQEVERRNAFSRQLLELLSRWKKETAEKRAGEESLSDLAERLKMEDDVVDFLMQQHKLLSPEEISRRQKDKPSGERDSGYSKSPATSGEMKSIMRHGVVFPPDNVPQCVGMLALPEVFNSLTTGPTHMTPDLQQHRGEAVQHSDDSSDKETTTL